MESPLPTAHVVGWVKRSATQLPEGELSEGTEMPTLSIDLTEDEHRRLQEGAAKAGSNVRDYVRSRVLDEIDALQQLGELLRPRIERAGRGETSGSSVADIARAARRYSRERDVRQR